MVGSLLFIARMWRPDIRYAVHKICIQASKPNITDVCRERRIISYLLATQDEGITLRELCNSLDIFTDAGEEEKATADVLVCGRSPLGWTVRRQDVITLLSTEDEYIVGAQTLAYNPGFHKRMKHIRRGHHFVGEECAEEGDITVHWVLGDENPADMLTKPVAGKKLAALKALAGMRMMTAKE